MRLPCNAAGAPMRGGLDPGTVMLGALRSSLVQQVVCSRWNIPCGNGYEGMA